MRSRCCAVVVDGACTMASTWKRCQAVSTAAAGARKLGNTMLSSVRVWRVHRSRAAWCGHTAVAPLDRALYTVAWWGAGAVATDRRAGARVSGTCVLALTFKPGCGGVIEPPSLF